MSCDLPDPSAPFRMLEIAPEVLPKTLERATWFVLWMLSDRAGFVEIGLEELADLVGVKPRTCREYLQRIIGAGMVEQLSKRRLTKKSPPLWFRVHGEPVSTTRPSRITQNGRRQARTANEPN